MDAVRDARQNLEWPPAAATARGAAEKAARSAGRVETTIQSIEHQLDILNTTGFIINYYEGHK